MLPATGNTSTSSLSGLGLLIVVIITWYTARKRMLALLPVVALALWWAPQQSVNAATLPELATIKISQWDSVPATATAVGTGNTSGFTADTYSPTIKMTAAGYEVDLSAYYHRVGQAAMTKTTLSIWQLIASPDGRYQAKRISKYEMSNLLFDSPTGTTKADFRFAPSMPGWYAYQYTNSQTYTDTSGKSRPIASKLRWVGATQPTKAISITASPLLLYGQATLTTATLTPPDSTDLVTWQPGHVLTLIQARDNTATLQANTAPNLNESPTLAGTLTTVSAKAGSISTMKILRIGGLKALLTTGDALPKTGLHHTTTGLETAGLPAGNWHFQWELADTKRDPNNKLQVITASTQAIEGASGDTDQLTDTAVALNIPTHSETLRTLTAAHDRGTPQALRLKLTNGNEAPLYTNYAVLDVTPAVGSLSLTQVPTTLSWSFTSLELYDHRAKTSTATGALEIDDTRQTPGWELTAKLSSASEFPFSMQLSDVSDALNVANPDAIVVASGGGEGLFVDALQASLTPTGQATAKVYQATLTWILTSTVDGNAL